MRLVLHVGMPKTGTSTLQTTLHGQRAVLAEAGVLYPASGPNGNHAPLLSLVAPIDRVPAPFRTGRREPAVRRSGRRAWERLTDEVRRSDAHTCVLSSEYFFSPATSTLAALDERLRALFDEILTVAYVRHPATYYVSAVHQWLGGTRPIPAPSALRTYIRHSLRRHAEAADELVVRPYDRAQLAGGCVVRDLLTHGVGDDALVSRVRVVDRNVRRSGEALCALQQLRAAHPEDEPAAWRRTVAAVASLDAALDAATPGRLRPDVAAALTRAHAADLAWLETRFGVTVPAPHEVVSADPGVDADEPPPDAFASGDLTQVLDHDPERLAALLGEVAAERWPGGRPSPTRRVRERLGRLRRRARRRRRS